MDAVLVSLPKPRLADRIGYGKKVQLMGKPSAFEYFAQPLALAQCIGREVHYHRLAGAQQGLDVVFLHFAQSGRNSARDPPEKRSLQGTYATASGPH